MSSVNASRSCSRHRSAISSSSSRRKTLPVGLCGELRTIARVRGATRESLVLETIDEIRHRGHRQARMTGYIAGSHRTKPLQDAQGLVVRRVQTEEAGHLRMEQDRGIAMLASDTRQQLENIRPRRLRTPPHVPYWSRAAATSALSMAPHVTRSSGRRPRLRRLHRRAAVSAIVSGSARSKASAFGMKSNADQIRIAP